MAVQKLLYFQRTEAKIHTPFLHHLYTIFSEIYEDF